MAITQSLNSNTHSPAEVSLLRSDAKNRKRAAAKFARRANRSAKRVAVAVAKKEARQAKAREEKSAFGFL